MHAPTFEKKFHLQFCADVVRYRCVNSTLVSEEYASFLKICLDTILRSFLYNFIKSFNDQTTTLEARTL